MDESHEKGHALESQVSELIQGIIALVGAEDRAEVVYHQPVMGKSTVWKPDLVLRTHALLEPLEEKSMELAVIECKYIDEAASEGTYWSQMSRAYMSLNDMRLANIASNFYLVVNKVNKSSKRSYSVIFKNIGVKLVNINSQEDISGFKSSVEQLIKESTIENQIQKLKQLKHLLKEKY